jgi:hypothetical protein
MDNRSVLGWDGERSLVVLRNSARQYGSRRSESGLGNGLSLWRFSILGVLQMPEVRQRLEIAVITFNSDVLHVV